MFLPFGFDRSMEQAADFPVKAAEDQVRIGSRHTAVAGWRKGCWTDHLKPLKPHHGVLRNGRIQVNKWGLIVRLHHRVERIDFREKSFHRMQKLLQKRSFARKR